MHNYYQHAKALLMPIRWEEPFGMVMIEALACGTPIIAIGKGSIPEVIVHDKTGFIVKTRKDMVSAIQRINRIDRKDCRDHVITNFSNQNMVKGYEAAFKKILKI